MGRKVFIIFPLLLYICTCSAKANTDDGNIYLFKNGSIIFETDTTSVDSAALENENKTLTLYSKEKNIIYSDLITNIDSITFSYVKPVADLMDIVFNNDGTAKDISPMGHTVQTINNGGLYTYFNNIYKRYAAHFDNVWGNVPSGNYHIDYATNQAFKDALSDGHSIEAIIMADYTPPIPNKEAKPFTSHQTGGTGFLISTSNSSGQQNEITFLPNISTTGNSNWIMTTSGVIPQPKVYYHIVGIWNKEKGKSYIYINGELKNTLNAVGELHFPATGAHWFGIGCDANTSNGELAWSGDVVLARIYNKPLTQNDVTVIWNEIKTLQKNAEPDFITDVEYISGLPVKIGNTYEIAGKGFKVGDKIHLIMIGTPTTFFTQEITPLENDSARFVIPENFKTGTYQMLLLRGEKSQNLGFNKLNVVTNFPKVPEINAHRGYWDIAGASQNSRTSLRNAIAINAYSSELDIWLTTDNHLMVNHDGVLNGVTIQTSTYDQVKNLKLDNGEFIPELKDMLNIMATSPYTKLVIEIKSHKTSTRTVEAAQMTMDSVAAAGLCEKIQYCSFSLAACQALIAKDPTATVFYINGDKTPQQLHDLGLAMDYNISVYRSNPSWIQQAHDLGMPVIAWTLDDKASIIEMANAQADVLATDCPIIGLQIRNYYLRHQNK